LLKACSGQIGRGEGTGRARELTVGVDVRLPVMLSGEGDDGDVVLGAAGVGGDLDVKE
jgi:hypothetical protein